MDPLLHQGCSVTISSGAALIQRISKYTETVSKITSHIKLNGLKKSVGGMFNAHCLFFTSKLFFPGLL